MGALVPGQKSGPAAVTYTRGDALREMAEEAGLQHERQLSVDSRCAPAIHDQPVICGGVQLRRMSEVEPEVVEWLWPPYIPTGKVTLLEGDPGVGKSWIGLAIATAVSLGKGLPGQAVNNPADVVLASAEDGLGDTIRPRLDGMHADVERVHAVDGALTLDDAGFLMLETVIASVQPALLIIDPLVAYLGGNLDLHRSNETRAVMARLARLATAHGLAVLAIRHLTKGGASRAIYRGLGSIDITAACRSALLAGCDPQNPASRGLVQIKSNLAPTGPAIGFELRDGGFYWTGESSLTAAVILASEDEPGASAGEEAADLLRDVLADGPVPAAEVWQEVSAAGLKDRTVKRAKARLGVRTFRRGEPGRRGGGVWVWELPDGRAASPQDLGGQEGHIGKLAPKTPSELKKSADPREAGPLNAVRV